MTRFNHVLIQLLKKHLFIVLLNKYFYQITKAFFS